jgi:hypothetical protein
VNVRQLLSYLILEVPRKNQDIVRLCFTDPRRVEDWNMSAREKFAVFVWIAVYRVVEKIGPDPAVIEKSVPFSGSAVAYNGFPLPFCSNQETPASVSRVASSRTRLVTGCAAFSE